MSLSGGENQRTSAPRRAFAGFAASPGVVCLSVVGSKKTPYAVSMPEKSRPKCLQKNPAKLLQPPGLSGERPRQADGFTYAETYDFLTYPPRKEFLRRIRNGTPVLSEQAARHPFIGAGKSPAN